MTNEEALDMLSNIHIPEECEMHEAQKMAVDALREKNKSISEKIEDIKYRICDEYCKYPLQGCPEGKDIGWLWEDEGSPCLSCPLNEL